MYDIDKASVLFNVSRFSNKKDRAVSPKYLAVFFVYPIEVGNASSTI